MARRGACAKAAIQGVFHPRLMPDGVMLEYLNFEGKPVRIVFVVNAEGRIALMRCEPASR